MSDEIFCLNVLVVSGDAQDRELLRRAALDCSVPIEISEVVRADEPDAIGEALQRDHCDVVMLDSRMPKSVQQAALDSIRAAKGDPLAILVAPAELRSRAVLLDGFAGDGALARPIDAQEAKTLFECCVRARLKCRVLVVDDSSTMRSIIRKVANTSRYRLDLEDAASASAAIERAGAERFDIVFLDCNMPDVDGFAAMEEIRRVSPESRIVMITGSRDLKIELRAKQCGAADFLRKPFFAPDIDAVLGRLFGLMKNRWD